MMDKTLTRVYEHYIEATKLIPENQILGCFLCGSQNYELDTLKSDVDTKLLIVPSLEDLALNKKPISTTHILENDEHLELKDVRLYIDTFRKQNINFIEILFTQYKVISPQYVDIWSKLEKEREAIARYNPNRAVRSMMGQIDSKYKNLHKLSPCQEKEVRQYGYASKELHHILRFENFLHNYMEGISYEECLVPDEVIRDYLKRVKVNPGLYTSEEAERIAVATMRRLEPRCAEFLAETANEPDEIIEQLFKEIQYELIKESIKGEFV